MRIDDGAEVVRGIEAGHEARRDRRRHGQHHRLVRADFLLAAVEGERVEPLGGEGERTQASGEARGGAPAREMRQRRIDQRFRQPVARHQRPAGLTAAAERLGDDARQQRGRALVRRGVERGDGQRLPQAAIERRAGVEHIVHRLARRWRGRARGAEIVAQMRARHAAPAVQQPPRHAAAPRPQHPAIAGGEIEERKFGGAGTDQRVGGADRGEILHRCAVATEQQVIAVIDAALEGRVEIRAAASARLLRRFMDDDRDARIGKPHRGGEARDAGADDVNAGRTAHQGPLTTGRGAARARASRASPPARAR